MAGRSCFSSLSNDALDHWTVELMMSSYINSQVTITTKTFLRYPELKVLLKNHPRILQRH
ncbi:hypothetical protein F7725_004101 [Dissostichus mawsoni]|uniref:Uncharacterized protein n=1 Tax=Dissostichus mawsoni TaxID=36200 RepID=A0A7J5YD06_DISMA|nr:hypothetical protein F7725_004101 [Dissostichus mawsoni]